MKNKNKTSLLGLTSRNKVMLMMTPPLLWYFWFHSIYSLAASCGLLSAVCGLQMSYTVFNLFLPSGKRKKEFGRKHSRQNPLTTTLSGVECQIDRFACFAAYFPSFPKENTHQSLENFRTINGKTEFPDFSLRDFPWLFPDLEKILFSLTFPW